MAWGDRAASLAAFLVVDPEGGLCALSAFLIVILQPPEYAFKKITITAVMVNGRSVCLCSSKLI